MISFWSSILPGFLIGALAVICGVAWWRQRRQNRSRDPYDLRTLFDAPPPQPDEPYEDTVLADAGPYCVACDEPNSVGTTFCRSCGSRLG